MKQVLNLLLLPTFLFLFLQPTIAQEPTVTANELNYLRGTWKGTLSYKDYTSGKTESLPIVMYGWRAGNETKSRRWKIKSEFPNEPKANSTDTYTISQDGRSINGAILVEKSTLANGALQLILEERGKDGNDHKPATFRHIIVVGEKVFSMSKWVKFDGATDFFERNTYQLSREF
jgi:hypothetical protein